MNDSEVEIEIVSAIKKDRVVRYKIELKRETKNLFANQTSAYSLIQLSLEKLKVLFL